MFYLRDEAYINEPVTQDQQSTEEFESTHLIRSFEEINLIDPFPTNSMTKNNAKKGSKSGPQKGRPSKGGRESSMMGTFLSGSN